MLRLSRCWVVTVVLVCSVFFSPSIASAAGEKEVKKVVTELTSAIRSAKQGGANRLAMTKLKRVIEKAKALKAIPAELLKEAEDALGATADAEEKLQAARQALLEATEQGKDAEKLAEAIRTAKELGLVKGPEISEAQSILDELTASQKKLEKQEAKKRKTYQDLEALSSASISDEKVKMAPLKAALTAAKSLFLVNNETEQALLKKAAEKLQLAELASLPLVERLDRASSLFGQEQCQSASETGKSKAALWSMCRTMTTKEWREKSDAVGEHNCQHPTLQPDGPEPPEANAMPKEHSKHFCKYPPPFDLTPSADGTGYRPAEFEFPPKLFNHTKLQEEHLADLAVVNLDMNLFRSNIAACQGKEVWLIEFFVHWCPVCQQAMSKFYKLAIALRTAGANLRIGAVNCAQQRDLCATFQVVGHPLISFFYGAGIGSDGRVQLFDYTGSDVRVNSALDSLKKNRDPRIFAGAPQKVPDHLFPAEHLTELVRMLPEEYRPSDRVLRWLGNSSDLSPTVCPDARAWFSRPEEKQPEAEEPPATAADEAVVVEQEAGEGLEAIEAKDAKHPAVFPGNGWPIYEHAATSTHRLWDAAQALVYTLEEWVVPNPAGPSPHAFTFLELKDVHAWVSLLADNFPSEAAGEGVAAAAVEGEGEEAAAPALLNLLKPLTELAARLQAKVDETKAASGKAALCEDEWQSFLYPLRREYDAQRKLRTLQTTCKSTTCRLWALLHIVSVAPLARGSDATGQNNNNFTASSPTTTGRANEAAFDAMTAFLRRYFTCTYCVRHFLNAVEKRHYGLDDARAGGPHDLAIWWWRYHGAVSARVLPGKCKVDRRWPPSDLCGSCWKEAPPDTKKPTVKEVADEAEVARELVARFWPPASSQEEGSSLEEEEKTVTV